MIHMRIFLSSTFAVSLAQATTIAIRYSAVRFQGQDSNGYILCDIQNDLIKFVHSLNIGLKEEFLIIRYSKQNWYLVYLLPMRF